MNVVRSARRADSGRCQVQAWRLVECRIVRQSHVDAPTGRPLDLSTHSIGTVVNVSTGNISDFHQSNVGLVTDYFLLQSCFPLPFY